MSQEQTASRSVPSFQRRHADVIHQSLDRLLAMAYRYQTEGNVWQAVGMYWMLVEEHAGTVQSLEAEQRLLKLAETYERNDARHMAHAIYKRLSDLGHRREVN